MVYYNINNTLRVLHSFSAYVFERCDDNKVQRQMILPLFGRDSRFFTGTFICSGLSFGLLVDREGKFEGCELTSSEITSDCFAFILDDSKEVGACTLADFPGEEPLASECDFLWLVPSFWSVPFDCTVETATLFFGLFRALALSSSACLPSLIRTPSLALLSSSLFSHGRTAIHLSTKFLPH
jgi:hypothetical protein